MTIARPRAHRSTPRRRVALLGTLLVAGALAGLLLLADALRHPLPGDVEILGPTDAGDPRIEPECPEPVPVEGEEREPAPVAAQAEIEPVNTDDLFDCPESWHGRRVRYRGEAVGGVLRRDGGAWVQLNDDTYAGDLGPLPAHREFRGGNAGIGVLVPTELADEVGRVGGPRGRGDVLEVVGTFHRVHPDHGEVAVIVAQRGRVVAGGEPIVQPLLADRLVAAGVLALLAVVVVVVERLSARRRW